MKKLIIFDCDGVLRTFSWQTIYDAYCVIGDHFEIDFRGLCPNVSFMRQKYSHDWRRNMQMIGLHDASCHPR